MARLAGASLLSDKAGVRSMPAGAGRHRLCALSGGEGVELEDSWKLSVRGATQWTAAAAAARRLATGGLVMIGMRRVLPTGQLA